MMSGIEKIVDELTPEKCKGCECANVYLDSDLNWKFECELEECYMGYTSYNEAWIKTRKGVLEELLQWYQANYGRSWLFKKRINEYLSLLEVKDDE